jgi:hypothetical protein
MDRLRRFFTSTRAATPPGPVAPPPETRAIASPETPTEVEATRTESGLPPNSQAPTRQHDMQGQP